MSTQSEGPTVRRVLRDVSPDDATQAAVLALLDNAPHLLSPVVRIALQAARRMDANTAHRRGDQ